MPNAPTGFVFPPGAGPVLLAQPPNSSSAATLGANPPDALGAALWIANALPPPPQPKVFAGGAVGAAGISRLSFGGSGVAHALPPHTSAPDKLLPIVARGTEGAGSGAGFGWLAERLKTELAGAVVVIGVELLIGGLNGTGAGAGAAGAVKSKRSPRAEEGGAAAEGLGEARVGEARALKALPPLAGCFS